MSSSRSSTTAPDPAGAPDRRPVLWLVGGVVALVAVVAVVVVLAFGGDDAAAPTTSASPGADADGSGDDAGDLRLPPELRGEVGVVEIDGDPLPPLPEVGPDPAIGTRPPTLVTDDIDGGLHTVSADIDGAVALVFLAHWCPACNQEAPELVELHADGRLPEDLQVYGVLTAMTPERPGFPPSQWITDLGWPFVALADGVDFDTDPPDWAAAQAFGLTAFPYVVVIDDGVVVDRWAGPLGADGLAERFAAAVG